MNLYGDLPPVGTGLAAFPAIDSKVIVSQTGWSRPNAGRIGQIPRSISIGAAGTTKSISVSASTSSKSKQALNGQGTANMTSSAPSSVNHLLVPVVSTEVINQKRSSDGIFVQQQSSTDFPPSSNQVTSSNHGASFDVEDPYDPSRPNDYLFWCEERIEKKRLEKIAGENKRKIAEGERARQDMEKERYKAMESGDVQRLENSMGAGRGRGRGLSNLPAWMAQFAAAPSTFNFEGGTSTLSESGQFDNREDVSERDTTAPFRNTSQTVNKEGESDTDDVTQSTVKGGSVQSPQEQDRMRAASRLIAAKLALTDPDLDQPTGAAAPRKRLGLFSNPSCVVLLKNMVQPGDVDESLAEECKQECSKYGPVRTCVIFEITTDPLCPEEECVRTFVCFEKQESAVKAYREMNGRFFGGRQITASFYDEAKFAMRNLDPAPNEWSTQ